MEISRVSADMVTKVFAGGLLYCIKRSFVFLRILYPLPFFLHMGVLFSKSTVFSLPPYDYHERVV